MNLCKLNLQKFFSKKKDPVLPVGFYLFNYLVLLIFIHFSFVFARLPEQPAMLQKQMLPEQYTDNSGVLETKAETGFIDSMYESMHLAELGLAKEAFSYALRGFYYLQQEGRLAKGNIISIADFSKPSSMKRLYVIDLVNSRVLFHTYVAHGVNSGRKYARQFSNLPASYQSSLGFYETQATYFGSNGYSLKLEGLEKGINDNAGRRAIVIHGADYADESLVKAQGYLGRSWGCPALPKSLNKPIIDKIKNGTCLFIYSPDNTYLGKSGIIKHRP